MAQTAVMRGDDDGYVGWVGDGTDHGLRDALTVWFGPSAPNLLDRRAESA
jgi:hypothetical protein